MLNHLRRFSAILIALVTLLGFWLYLESEGRTELIIWLLAVALLMTLAYPIWLVGREAVLRYRQHPALIRAAEVGEEVVRSVRAELRRIETAIPGLINAAVAEGRDQLRGEILGQPPPGTSTPTLLTMVFEEDEFVLVAEYAEWKPPIGARFRLVLRGASQPIASLNVYAINESERTVALKACDFEPSSGWKRLAQAAETDPTPPAVYSLEPFEESLSEADPRPGWVTRSALEVRDAGI